VLVQAVAAFVEGGPQAVPQVVAEAQRLEVSPAEEELQ
jgi:hypothetical protein